jgi:Phosphotransferase enzyme family
MSDESSRAQWTDTSALGVSLGPVLREVCSPRLSEIEWFRASWQQGGAATGYATWTADDGTTQPAMVKLPVGPNEHSWTMRLGAVDPAQWESDASMQLPTPRVFAAGEALGGYDIAWLIVERFEGKPLSKGVSADSVKDLLETAARFYSSANRVRDVVGPDDTTDWEDLLSKSRRAIREHDMDGSQRWNAAVKNVQKHLPTILAAWHQRPITSWCHGDLHLGNAMRRGERCVLIDLALVHPGCWVEDAVYLERLFWGHADAIKKVRPVSFLAKRCKEQGIETGFDYTRMAQIRRVLIAACVPVFLDREGSPAYLEAALKTLEQATPDVIR